MRSSSFPSLDLSMSLLSPPTHQRKNQSTSSSSEESNQIGGRYGNDVSFDGRLGALESNYSSSPQKNLLNDMTNGRDGNTYDQNTYDDNSGDMSMIIDDNNATTVPHTGETHLVDNSNNSNLLFTSNTKASRGDTLTESDEYMNQAATLFDHSNEEAQPDHRSDSNKTLSSPPSPSSTEGNRNNNNISSNFEKLDAIDENRSLIGNYNNADFVEERGLEEGVSDKEDEDEKEEDVGEEGDRVLVSEFDHIMDDVAQMIGEAETYLDEMRMIQVKNSILMDSLVMVGA